MWLYNGSGRNVLVVALFHSAFNSAWGTGDKKVRQRAALRIRAAVCRGDGCGGPRHHDQGPSRLRARARGTATGRGGGAGFWNVMRIYPEESLGAIVMGNTTSYDHNAIVGVPWK